MDKLEKELEELISLRKKILSDYNVRSDIKPKHQWFIGLATKLVTIEERIERIDFLLNSESQGDISASTGESDILHLVVERDVTRSSTTEPNEEDVNRALKNRIDCEKFYCLGKVMNEHLLENVKPCETQCVGCSKH